jgi:hypothetical protein
MKFDTKIAAVIRDDLPIWQKLNDGTSLPLQTTSRIELR